MSLDTLPSARINEVNPLLVYCSILPPLQVLQLEQTKSIRNVSLRAEFITWTIGPVMLTGTSCPLAVRSSTDTAPLEGRATNMRLFAMADPIPTAAYPSLGPVMLKRRVSVSIGRTLYVTPLDPVIVAARTPEKRLIIMFIVGSSF